MISQDLFQLPGIQRVLKYLCWSPTNLKTNKCDFEMTLVPLFSRLTCEILGNFVINPPIRVCRSPHLKRQKSHSAIGNKNAIKTIFVESISQWVSVNIGP